ncbi:hypothetical protein ABW19_dt0208559 [Dactylella cylindrospora]|nr:hypothetical protein ABW19_dt0208559 [Dactylella cylindrospora]
MEVNPTVYVVTTLTVDPDAPSQYPNASDAGTTTGTSSGYDTVTTIGPTDPILFNTYNLVASDNATTRLPSTIQIALRYYLHGSNETEIPPECEEQYIYVTIPPYSDYDIEVPTSCVRAEYYIPNYTKTTGATTKTAVVIETKGQDDPINIFHGPNETDPAGKRPKSTPSNPNPRPSKNPETEKPKDEPSGPVHGPNFNVGPDPSPSPSVPPNSPNQEPSQAPENPNVVPNFNPSVDPTSVDPVNQPEQTPSYNPDNFNRITLAGPTNTAGTTGGPSVNPDPTNRNRDPSIEAVPVPTTISGKKTTSTNYVGITMVPKTTSLRGPDGVDTQIVIFSSSKIPITSFKPTVDATPVVTTVNGRRTTYFNVNSVVPSKTIVKITTTISGSRTVISSTFYLPSTVRIPQYGPFLTTTIGPTIINGVPTLGPKVVTLSQITKFTYITETISGTTKIHKTSYVVPATTTLPDPLIKTVKVSTVIDGKTTTINFPISLSASPKTSVITTTQDGTKRVITTTFYVPQGVPLLDLPSVILRTTTVDGKPTTISEFYSITPVSITTTIGGKTTILLVPSVIPITTPTDSFTTSYERTTVDGKHTSYPVVYYLQPTSITTVIDGKTTVIQTTTAVPISTSIPPHGSSIIMRPYNGTNATTTSGPRTTALPSITLMPTLTPPPPNSEGAETIRLSSLSVCIGAFISSIVFMFFM